MGYEVALDKAWEELIGLACAKDLSVKFLGDEYNIDLKARKVISLSCNVAAKDFAVILILHYLVRRIKGLPQPANAWVSFKELSGIEGYGPAFRKRVVEPVIRKYGKNPKAIFSAGEGRLRIKQFSGASDAGIVVEVFEGVPVLVEIWSGDEEFGPEANMLFDKSIRDVFCIEDIVVLGGFVAAAL